MLNITRTRDKQREAAAQDRMFSAFERALNRKMYREFTRTSREAAAMYKKTFGSDIAALSVMEEHGNRVYRILVATYTPVIRTMAARVYDAADGVKGTAPGETKDRAGDIDRLVEDYIDTVGLDHSVSIAETSKSHIQRVLSDGANNGLNPVDLAKNVNSALGGTLGRFRSEMIARTEVHSAAMNSSLTAANSLNLTLLKEWIPVEDDRTRESHVEMLSHEAINPDEYFNVNGSQLMYPGDPNGPPEESINCRCIMVYKEKFANV